MMKNKKKRRSKTCLILEILSTLVFYCDVISGKKTAYTNPYINMKYYKAVEIYYSIVNYFVLLLKIHCFQ